ncbi:MAG TPA: hypothetical protein VK338_01225 [Candidatus Nitrosocosmicus sp.]|nr:hypothetical protein [Candidatus Nitrosocosmicus sp.]
MIDTQNEGFPTQITDENRERIREETMCLLRAYASAISSLIGTKIDYSDADAIARYEQMLKQKMQLEQVQHWREEARRMSSIDPFDAILKNANINDAVRQFQHENIMETIKIVSRLRSTSHPLSVFTTAVDMVHAEPVSMHNYTELSTALENKNQQIVFLLPTHAAHISIVNGEYVSLSDIDKSGQPIPLSVKQISESLIQSREDPYLQPLNAVIFTLKKKEKMEIKKLSLENHPPSSNE